MSELHFSGGCLCGAVHYEVTGTEPRFYHCHCERCRKATGTGHASNILLKPADVRFTRGEELLKRYKVPEANRFAMVFCTECGSPLPRTSPEAGIVVIPAGSLDEDPGIRPNARIFNDSRADWSCSDPDTPCYAEYPGQ